MGYADFQLGTLGSEVLISINDCTYTSSIEMLANEARLQNGSLVRQKIAQMRHFKFAYSWIPGKKTYVFDGGMGRDDLYTLYQNDVEMSLLVPQDQGPQLAYTVRFVKNSWQESLKFRSGDFWAWMLSFELVQTR